MTQSRAIVDKLLTGVSNGIFPQGYISEQILTPISAVQWSGKIANYGNDHLRIVKTLHSGKGGYLRVEPVTRGSNTYNIEENALSHLIDERDFDNVEDPYDAREDATIGLTTMLWLAKEKALADTLMDPTVITNGTTLSGNNQYDNLSHADSTPLEDALTARGTIRDAIGMPPNAAIMSGKVADALRYHGQLLDSLGYKDNRPGGLNNDELARALNVDRVLVGDAVYNSAKEGQTDSITPVWAKDLIYAHVGGGTAKTRMQKVLGFEVRKAGTNPREVRRYVPEEPVNSEVVIVRDLYDQLITTAGAAYLVQDAIG